MWMKLPKETSVGMGLADIENDCDGLSAILTTQSTG